jgi:hypothetical protein
MQVCECAGALQRVQRWQEGQAAAGGPPERAHRVTVSDALCQSTRAAPMLRRPIAHGPMGEDPAHPTSSCVRDTRRQDSSPVSRRHGAWSLNPILRHVDRITGPQGSCPVSGRPVSRRHGAWSLNPKPQTKPQTLNAGRVLSTDSTGHGP